MKEYVLTHAKVPGKGVLLVLKDRPAWQKGRLNLVGGKIEPGEWPVIAAARELEEESGLYGIDRPELMGRIVGVDCVIHCCRAIVFDQPIKPREGESELVQWYSFQDAFNDPRLMPNLKLVIPLLASGVTGWTVVDQDSSIGMKTHHLSVEIEIPKPFING